MENEARTRNDRGTPVRLVLVAGLLAAIWVSQTRLADARTRHRAMLTRVVEMSTMGDRIRELRSAPRLAIDRVRPNDELLRQVHDAAHTAGIPADHWRRNDPRPSVRLPDSPYKKVGALITFDRLTIRQLVEFLQKLVAEDSTLSIENLRLTRPDRVPGDAWNAEVTLAYLIYSPANG